MDTDAAGLLHLTAGGECSWFEFTEAIMELAGIEVPIEPVNTTRAPGAADRPAERRAGPRPRADAAGLTPLRHWREALADYMSAAGLQASADDAGPLRALGGRGRRRRARRDRRIGRSWPGRAAWPWLLLGVYGVVSAAVLVVQL